MTDEEKRAEEQRLKDKDKIVTQAEVDKWFKQAKTNEEKLNTTIAQLEKSEAGKVDLVNRVAILEKNPPVIPKEEEKPEEQEKNYGRQADGTIIFPKTPEDWDNLNTDNPTLHADLRYAWNSQDRSVKDEFVKSALKVAEKHPDMYQQDEGGKVKISDGTAKVGSTIVPKGCPIVNMESDKFKIYMDIIARNGFDADGQPIILHAKRGPELIMAAMENEITTKGLDNLKTEAEKEKKIAADKREADVKDGKIAPPGKEPPPPPKVEVKFNSEYERKRAEASVTKGLYKNLEEYCQVRDNPTIPYNRGV